MSGVNEIRSTFLNYFAANGHEIVASSPLVPRNDPTLMFTNAGMVPFKNVFTGVEKRPYSRAVSAQKCVRAGGKHNDLDNVGYTARHHTFFEMLGNFSFGDYFKENAIELAWKLITKEYGLPEKKLLVTVFSEDDEAAMLWKKIAGLSDDKIIRIPTSDNFWTMGDTGPCGPCSEIFYDHGDHIAGGPPGSPDQDGDRFIEIWNLVFMQYDQTGPDQRLLLPRPSIDTGMGLERISAVLQGTHDNYATDLMRALIEAVANATGVDPDGPQSVSHRVIADHLRASAFLVADGVLPSNEGRGYVVRRIMRRAMRHAQLLGSRDPLMWRLVPALVRQMGQAYPELVRAESLITETLHLEEKRFRKTLERGLTILDSESSNLNAGDQLSGEVAFTLYDTYGFPLDLTQDALRPRSIAVDLQGFDAAMTRQRQLARAAWSGSGEAATETLWFGLKDRLGATEFLGYEVGAAEGVVSALIHEGNEVTSLKAGDEGLLLVNQTPFYGESGGQVGDTGHILAPGLKAEVLGTSKKLSDLFIHRIRMVEGELVVGAAVELVVDNERHRAIRSNHSATHLLHEALREILGDHVAQKGSLVAPDRLRFDFSHPTPISANELRQIEDLANKFVLRNEPVETRLMAVDEAIETGARALFGEKYGDEVRVVTMGTRPEAGGKVFSVELCGGTHVARTGDIGLIRIVSEGAVASGVRRLEAMTGEVARRHLIEESQLLHGLADLLRTPVNETGPRLEALIEERRKLERDLTETRKKLALGGNSGAEEPVLEVGGTRLLARAVAGIETKDLKSLADDAKKRVGSGVVAIIGVAEDGKAGIVVGVTDDVSDRFDAVALVRIGAEKLGGKGGGGRRDLAQAGGPNADKAQEALDAIAAAIAGN
ncbi:alanine--tRNA ligase [Pseudochelatococcus sp. G4_1912]|uniref:alanine--tRNA ligase n=1 Tax=Pseudochelatococcus sp. G4_1912 TaxID=3114288 RepID=UPI0039C73530